jgi:hypothetical protein
VAVIAVRDSCAHDCLLVTPLPPPFHPPSPTDPAGVCPCALAPHSARGGPGRCVLVRWPVPGPGVRSRGPQWPGARSGAQRARQDRGDDQRGSAPHGSPTGHCGVRQAGYVQMHCGSGCPPPPPSPSHKHPRAFLFLCLSVSPAPCLYPCLSLPLHRGMERLLACRIEVYPPSLPAPSLAHAPSYPSPTTPSCCVSCPP